MRIVHLKLNIMNCDLHYSHGIFLGLSPYKDVLEQPLDRRFEGEAEDITGTFCFNGLG